MLKRFVYCFVLLCFMCSTASAISIDEFEQIEGSVAMYTRNPKFEEVLACQNYFELDSLLYPHMPNFPTKYMDFACFNCTDVEYSLSQETAEFLFRYFPSEGMEYTNAEVLSAQLYVGLAMMQGGEDSDVFWNSLEYLDSRETAWGFDVYISEFDTCIEYLNSKRSYLDESFGFSGGLNIEGVPFSLGLTSKFDVAVRDRDVAVYSRYWSGLNNRLQLWGAVVGSYGYGTGYNPFIYQQVNNLPYPGMPEESSDLETAPEQSVLDSDEGSEDFTPSTEGRTDPSFGEDRRTGESYVPDDQHQYIDSIGAKDSEVPTQEADTPSGLPRRQYGLNDILLAVSVVTVIVSCTVFCIQDWIVKRRDPLRNYPKWR